MMTSPPPIEEMIPHRPPFLFLDEIMILDDRHVEARYRAREDADYFRGHYPDLPLMPGVLMVEMALQASAYFMAATGPRLESDRVPVVARLRDVRFKRPVLPGSVLVVTASAEEMVAGAQFMRAVVKVEDKTVMTAGLTVTAGPRPGASP